MSNDFKDIFGDWKPGDERSDRPEGSPYEFEGRGSRQLNEKEVKVVNVFEGIVENPNSPNATQNTTFVLLRDNVGREFRIFVVRDVAMAIRLALDSELPDRPYTHDLMYNILGRLGATVSSVTIDDLWKDTFYARITVTRGAESYDIDARPSDSIALALRFRAPIYVAEMVLEAAQQE